MQMVEMRCPCVSHVRAHKTIKDVFLLGLTPAKVTPTIKYVLHAFLAKHASSQPISTPLDHPRLPPSLERTLNPAF